MSFQMPSGRRQPDVVRTQDKKPADVHATNQQQSSRGHYDSRGGDRFKKFLLWGVALFLILVVVLMVIDVATGKGLGIALSTNTWRIATAT